MSGPSFRTAFSLQRARRLASATARTTATSLATALLALLFVSDASAQNTSVGSPAGAGTAPAIHRATSTRVALGRSIQVAADEEVTEGVVVVGGSLRVDGRVRDGIVIIGGNLDLGPRADVRGDIVLVGGRLTRAAGAQIRGSVSNIAIGDWRSWRIGGLSLPMVEFGGAGRWLTVFGTAFRIAVLGILMALMVLIARAPVARVGRAAAAQPGRAFALGLAAEILFLPALIIVCVGLAVTVIGIPVAIVLLPLAFLGGLVALLLGFTGLACRLGELVEDRLGWRGRSALVATAVGMLLILAPAIVARMMSVAPQPMSSVAVAVLVAALFSEFVAWTVGLGATLMTGFGRWSTTPPPLPSPLHGTAVAMPS